MRYKLHLLLLIFLELLISMTDGTSEDYALLVKYGMQNDINIAEIQATFINDSYKDMLTLILDLNKRVLEEIHLTNVKLTLLQSMDSVHKHCIQQYEPGLFTKKQAKEKFDACQDAAELKSQKFFLDVQIYLNSAKQIANINLSNDVQDCLTTATDQLKCVVEKASANSMTFDKNLDDMQDKLEGNHGLSALVARKALECSFKAEKLILMRIGSTLQLIDMCVENEQVSAVGYEGYI